MSFIPKPEEPEEQEPGEELEIPIEDPGDTFNETKKADIIPIPEEEPIFEEVNEEYVPEE